MFDFEKASNAVNTYEGPGGGYYDKKDETRQRFRMAGIWIGLFILFAMFLTLSISGHVRDILLKTNGNKIVADYTPGNQSVIVRDENNEIKVINVSDFLLAYDNNTISLYYWGGDIGSARPLTMTIFWVLMEVCWGGLTILCIFFIRKNLRKTKHAQTDKSRY